jgi:hypothetical protein
MKSHAYTTYLVLKSDIECINIGYAPIISSFMDDCF